MTEKTAQLLNEVRQLPEPERWAFLAELLDEMDALPDPDAEDDAAWLAEIERRAQDAITGRVKGIPGPQVFEEARRRLRRS